MKIGAAIVTGVVIVHHVIACLHGVFDHYLLESPDHIAYLPHGTPHLHATFQWTVGVIAMLEGISAMAAGYFLGRGGQRRDATG